MPTDADIVKMVNELLKGGRFVEMAMRAGAVTQFVFIFEDDQERRATLTMQPQLRTEQTGSELKVQPGANFTLTPFAK